jgi:mono/diheme cytochrome c family protein
MTTSRPVDGVRIRYFWRVRMRGHRSESRGATNPHARIECAPVKRALPRLAVLLVATGGLGGCALKHPTAELSKGKTLFLAKCGSCHTLAHAGSTTSIGPNLDDAFRQDRADGVKSTSIQGLVDYWINYPDSGGVMPPRLLTGQDAQDVAAYVALVAAIPGQDTGLLAQAGAVTGTSAAAGKTVFTGIGGCGACHTLGAAATTGTVGPNLDTRLRSDCALPASQKIRGATLAKCIQIAIIKPYAFLPSGYAAGVMPSNFSTKLKPNEITALVNFLESSAK